MQLGAPGALSCLKLWDKPTQGSVACTWNDAYTAEVSVLPALKVPEHGQLQQCRKPHKQPAHPSLVPLL